MRVIAGKYGSRPLKTLRGMALRPTSDRLRETLFNILGATVEGALFVDVYAGTGAVGIEALSRGAGEVIFIEKHSAAVALIRENLESLEIKSGFEILAKDAMRGLESLSTRRLGGHVLADFFFVDPPYEEQEEYREVLEYLDGSRLLARHGTVIVEHASRHVLPERLVHLERARLLEQGDASLSFYRFALAA
jgi:16S rRNA (guanine(966)-N(2))-methyltransferase RsmD